MRKLLPSRRKNQTYKFRIVDTNGTRTTVHFAVGFYDDGTIGELFVDMHKQGAALRDWAGKTAMLASRLFQEGLSLEEVAKQFVGHESEPRGKVELYGKLLMCSSVMDCIMRILLIEYNNRTDLIESNETSVPHEQAATDILPSLDPCIFEYVPRYVPELADVDPSVWAIDYNRLNASHRALYQKPSVLPAD